jgi:predicted nucleotidyltransferase
MINGKDKQSIHQIAKKYQAKRVILFGSSLLSGQEGKDIDIGIEGIEGKDFFSFYGELLCTLSKPVDVIDLSVKSRFVDLIQQEGIILYA